MALYASNVVFIIHIGTLFIKNYSRRVRRVLKKLKSSLKKFLPAFLFKLVCVCFSQGNLNNGRKSQQYPQTGTLQPLDQTPTTIVPKQAIENVISDEQINGPSISSKVRRKSTKKINNYSVMRTANPVRKSEYTRKININVLNLFPIPEEKESLEE